jgi:hypothetical protein
VRNVFSMRCDAVRCTDLRPEVSGETLGLHGREDDGHIEDLRGLCQSDDVVEQQLSVNSTVDTSCHRRLMINEDEHGVAGIQQLEGTSGSFSCNSGDIRAQRQEVLVSQDRGPCCDNAQLVIAGSTRSPPCMLGSILPLCDQVLLSLCFTDQRQP